MGKRAGYGWLILDVQTGVMVMNDVPHAIADYVRLGGHIFAGMWIVTVSLPGSMPVKVSGITSGACMFLFSFVSRFLPLSALGPVSLLVVVWLGFIAAQNGVKSASQMPLAGQPGYNH